MNQEFSAIKTYFLKEVGDNKGSLRHDYTNPLHYEYALASLGGKEFLQKKYPHLFKLFEKSQQYHFAAKACSDGVAQRNPSNEAADGFTDYEDIKYISLDSQYLHSCIRADYQEIKPSIAFTGTLTDRTNNHIVDMVNVYDEESNILEDVVSVPFSQLIDSDDKVYEMAVTIHHLNEKDGHDLSITSCTKVFKDVKMIGKKQIVTDFKVNAPIPVKTPSRDYVVVVYNRKDVVGDNDYSYDNKPDNNKVQIFMSASATVTLTKDWQILCLNENAGYLLDLEDLNKGIVVHYNGYDSCFINDNQITWTFKEAWNNHLDISNFNVGTKVQIYCKVAIDIKNKTTGMEIINFPLVFQSKNTQSHDKSVAISKSIYIQWGCIGKDTLILMADHTQKKITDIQIGDLVLNENQEAVPVKNIYTGQEKNMILLRTQNQKQALVTDGHPVSTDRGILPARCLRASDLIKTVDGYEVLVELRTQPYQDTVYSLAFESENCIICNGMVLGDFGMQQIAKAPQEESVPILRSKECIKVQKEFKKLMEELNSKKEEIIQRF